MADSPTMRRAITKAGTCPSFKKGGAVKAKPIMAKPVNAKMVDKLSKQKNKA